MAMLFYTLGYPGAGKTTFARQLSRWFNGPHLQADKIGMQLFRMPTFSEAERVAVYQHMDYQAMAALNAGKTLVFDGTINTHAQREHLRQTAARHSGQAIGIWLNVPVVIAKERAGRLRNVGDSQIGGRVVPPEIFDRHVAAFEAPDPQELVVRVDGLESFGYQYRQLQQQLARYGIQVPRLTEL